ncbi:response regulator transcription factor [Variovorax sp. Sphag1AA]|uniref:LuxR C-terminal-related transcriptional regulator n=1 Tax=Variovorax sp. Sphag1AA TaxID=2587027 RepID=UPI0021A4863E|nr:response regulator transcription factor [Variovorax sp. Sphag1AA]
MLRAGFTGIFSVLSSLLTLGKAMKILIADDHRLVIEAVKAKLSEIEADIEFVLAMSVDELLAGASDDIDLAMIDLNMPGAEGQAHIDEIRRRHPAVPVIVLSGYEDPAVMRSALERGVLGFIPKAYSPEVMLSAVRLVLAGGVYVPPMMLSSVPPGVIAGIPGSDAVQRSGAAPGGAQTLEHLRNVLTERQVEVLQLLSQGKPNKLIGRALGISEGTVKIHLAAIFRALNVRNRTEAVVAAQSLTEA